MNRHKPSLVLASASVGRKHLLEQAGLTPDIIAPTNIDETPHKGENAKELALRLAIEKGKHAANIHTGSFIISADSVGTVGRRILTKAKDEAEARTLLNLMAGRRHKMHTGVCVISPDGSLRKRLVSSSLKLKRLSKEEMDWYIASGEWQGKAGCYTLEGRGSLFIEWIEGSYSGIIGLPLCETRAMLIGLGYILPN